MFRLPRTLACLALLASLAGTGCLDKSSEHRIRANAFLRGGDAKSAVAECDQGLAIKKDDPALLMLKGKALFELDDLDASRFILSTGPSGHPLSRFYDSMLRDWRDIRYVRFARNRAEAERGAAGIIDLKPIR